MTGKWSKAVVLAGILVLFVLIPAAGGKTCAAGAENTASAEDGLPAFYDARDAGKKPVVKSQGKLSTCWALTATSALEAAFMPEAAPVFSADHMSMNNGFSVTQEDGGDYKMIMAYLAGWYGPVLEEDDPYGDEKTDPKAPAAAHVQQMRLLKGLSREDFKRAVMQFGPVQSSLYLERKTMTADDVWYNEKTFAYYCSERKKRTHDLLILGWDDTFPSESFLLDPGTDGAWICQNTWGEDFGDDGIVYVSYADANFAASGISYEKVYTADHYDHIYQHDVCGWQGRQGYQYPSCYFANVYTCGGEEQLEAVGFYSLGEKTSYEVYLIHDFEAPSSFMHKRAVAEGEISGKGYFTVPLDEPEKLGAGERFAVAVNIRTEGSKKPVAVEVKKDKYTQFVTTEGKESYISLAGGEWENTQEKYGTNVCLKAYTGDRE